MLSDKYLINNVLNMHFFTFFIIFFTFSTSAFAIEKNKTLYIGNINSGSGSGIYSCIMSSDGILNDLRKEANVTEPSYITQSSNGQILYTFGKDTTGKSKVYSFKVNSDRTLKAIDSTNAQDAAFCYISLNKQQNNVLCASYDNGLVASYSVSKNGKFTGQSHIKQHSADGVKPLVHSIIEDPKSGYYYVADLGLDKIFIYDLTKSGFKIIDEVKTRFGAGPRHISFSPNGSFMAVSNELDHTITIYKRNDIGIFNQPMQVIDLKPFTSNNLSYGGDIAYSVDGNFLYATLRGDCSIVSMSVNYPSGTVNTTDWMQNGIHWSRSITPTLDGNFLLVTNHRGSNVTSYKITQSGNLEIVTGDVKLKDASCVIISNLNR